jgi:hypothetical protein
MRLYRRSELGCRSTAGREQYGYLEYYSTRVGCLKNDSDMKISRSSEGCCKMCSTDGPPRTKKSWAGFIEAIVMSSRLTQALSVEKCRIVLLVRQLKRRKRGVAELSV